MQERAAYILLNMEYSHPSRTLFLLSLARLLGQGLSHLTQPCRRRNPKPKAPFKKKRKKKRSGFGSGDTAWTCKRTDLHTLGKSLITHYPKARHFPCLPQWNNWMTLRLSKLNKWIGCSVYQAWYKQITSASLFSLGIRFIVILKSF